MKILQIGTSYRFGGIESYLLNYARNIDRSDLQFDFLTFCDDLEIEQYHKDLMKTGSKIIFTTNYRRHPISGLFNLIKIINDNNYDIVHYNMNSAVYLLPLIAGKLSKAKVVIAHSHNSSSDKGFLKKIIHEINKHFIPFFANYYFACSKRAGEWFFSKNVRNGSNYKIVKNAIESNKFEFCEKERKLVRKQFNIKDNEILIGHVGRFNEQKNHIFLIKIFNELYKINNNYKLILIGEGPKKEEIISEIKKMPSGDNIIILEQRNDINRMMQMMDVFVLPSLYEGLPLVGIEAQCAGLKCFFANTITDELMITKNAFYIDITESPLIIANYIDSEISKGFDRNTKNEIINSGYDIKKSSDELKKYYYKILNITK